ncbi:Hsp20/alpha crystallin family protein [Compostibacter hankyongensis]|uniref:SHSP domain-containing protein n=1 Tax=Compostibacter hankyongensis TaxID=1007089 RepID=A0ABP8FC14_9BACT
MGYRTYACGPRAPYGRFRGRRFSVTPPLNIEETETAYHLTVYAPVLRKENISVSTQSDVLYIRYKAEEKDTAQFIYKEYTGGFERSIDLKGKVDTSGIEASYEDGVLRIVLPKTSAAGRPSQDVPVA